MPVKFYQSTAELVVQVADAVQAFRVVELDNVKDFCDLSSQQAENALKLAVDLGLIQENQDQYSPANPLIIFFSSPNEETRSALLRLVLESYLPFTTFRRRLIATGLVDAAANQTKSLLDLDAHREEIKDTLLSLGTYTKAIISEGGGKYTSSEIPIEQHISYLSKFPQELATAQETIHSLIGSHSNTLNREEVIIPLATSLIKAKNGDSLNAVRDASRAVESFIFRLANSLSVNIATANGIVEMLTKFRTNNKLPKKIVEAAKYLGQVRNAADHGVDKDPDVDAVWIIQSITGLNYVFCSCAFIRSTLEREFDGDHII